MINIFVGIAKWPEKFETSNFCCCIGYGWTFGTYEFKKLRSKICSCFDNYNVSTVGKYSEVDKLGLHKSRKFRNFFESVWLVGVRGKHMWANMVLVVFWKRSPWLKIFHIYPSLVIVRLEMSVPHDMLMRFFSNFVGFLLKKIHWVKNSPTIWSILSKLGLLRICFEVWRILAYIRPNFVISWKFTRGIFTSIWPGEWKSGFQDQCGIFVGLAGLAISLECRGCIESMWVHFWGEAEALGIN